MKYKYYNIHDANYRSPLYRINENKDVSFFDADCFVWMLSGRCSDMLNLSRYEISRKEAFLLKEIIRKRTLAEKLLK